MTAFDRAWRVVKNEDDDFPDPATWAAEGRESDKCIGCGRPFAKLSPQEQSNSPRRCKTCEMVGDLMNPSGGGQDDVPPEQLSQIPYRDGKHPTHLDLDLIEGRVWENGFGQSKCSQRFYDQERFPEIYDNHVSGKQEADFKCMIPWGEHCPCCGKIPYETAVANNWDDDEIEYHRDEDHLCHSFDDDKYWHEQEMG